MRILLNRVVFLLCVFVVVLPVSAQNPPGQTSQFISVNEKSAQLKLLEKSSLFSVEVSANTAIPRSAKLSAKIASPDGATLAEAATPLRLTSQAHRFELPLNWVPSSYLNDVSAARLFYKVELDGDSSSSVSGILSPYKLIPDLFVLHFSGLNSIGLGKTYFAHVRAVHPDTNVPVPDVALSGFLGDDDADTPKSLKPTARTNARGEAILKFRLPGVAGASDDSQIDLEIRGSRGNFKNSLTTYIQFWRRAAMVLSTDKPLYQPEQTLHMRALLIDDQRHAWPKQSMRFEVRDPDDTTVFTADVTTSRFGIASADWPIPATQKLGFYRVTIEATTDGNRRDLQLSQSIHISRYELPTFTVNVRTDHPFYLPGQNADLTVCADYVFGKPVLRGHVRVKRESSRRWNYQDQKWDVDDTSVGEGELNTKNEFHLSLDLAKDQGDFQERDWERFEDLRFAAYVTDASSGHTEERHFDVRISHEPMHIYVLNSSTPVITGLSTVLYLSCDLADGTPTPADLTVRLFSQDPSDPNIVQTANRPLASAVARANKYGTARVAFPALHKTDLDENKRLYAAIDAKSPDGRIGKHLESYSVENDATFHVSAAKVVLNPGDPIVAIIESSAPKSGVRLDVVSADTQSILASEELKLSTGSMRVVFPFKDEFVGKLALVAYNPEAEETGYSAVSSEASVATVVFPEPSTLKLDVTPLKKSYRPGESAAVRLQVRGTQNEATEGAFGFLVYDQALEELARTEASLTSANYDRIDPLLGFQNPLEEDFFGGSIREKDLLNRAPGSPVSADLELAAEALYSSRSWAPLLFESSDSERNLSRVFATAIATTLNPAGRPIQDFFTKFGHFPSDEATYASVLKNAGFDASHVTDPWGHAYRVRRSYAWLNEVFEFRSDGPDKTPNTTDDFTAYDLRRPFFEQDEARIRSAISAYQAHTGNFIRDETALKLACDEWHTPLSSFVDPWGTSYRFDFGVERDNFTITVTSAGPDRKFRAENYRNNFGDDDLRVAVIRSPYFFEISKRIDQALFENAKATQHFPETENEFREALQQYSFDWASLRDPWGRPYRVEVSTKFDYSDKVTIRAYGQNTTASSSPLTHALKTIAIKSDGPDGIPNNADDFSVAFFLSPFREGTSGANFAPAALPKTPVIYSGASGAIRVEIKDQSGAIIQNAKVTATNQTTGVTYTGLSNEQGICLVVNLPAGTYRLLVESTGFQSYVLTSVPVFSSNATNVEVTLSVGATTEMVEVRAEAVQLRTEASSVQGLALIPPGGVGLATKSGAARGEINIPMATPRLREYFPETLLWRPEVLTDLAGQATVKFPLADSITTWKVSAIASTLDGRIATASADFRAFQPFFSELDPPKVLTVGDEIHLPVTVRNYLDRPQSVSLDWSAEPWSQTLSSRTAQLDVPAGDYSQNIFAFRAALPLKNALQRLTAFNRSTRKESDAIERKLRVHPDGQEQLRQSSSIFSGATTLSLDVPSAAVPGSVEAELVVYPNLFAHLSDAIEGIMERPYGCAEQTISSAYPSLLWLQLQKSENLPVSALDTRAKHYLNLAYAKLVGYRDTSGGFSYWGKGDPYVPLTAYALRFLTEASEFIAVDPDVIAGTRRWLLEQASPDGTWGKPSDAHPSEWQTNYYSSYVVRILSRDLLHAESIDKKELQTERKLVTAGIEYLSKSAAANAEPYRVALLALAKLSLKQDASSEISWLLANKHSESETVYWNLEQNTLFYGWGLAGRLETTALVLEALATAKQQGNADPALESTLNLGTYFLLKNKDRYHVWYSTQATVNVLQCLVGQLALDGSNGATANSPAIVFVDGKPGPALPISSDARQLTPQRADLSSYLGPGPHRVEIRGDSVRRAAAYLHASYYLPWKDPAVLQNFIPSGDSESIRYSVNFDRTSLVVGGQILCTVHAERVGFRGYGMMLAEVGLPPGADVDRASLDAAVAANWSVQSYEIQPDHVVLYLWPSAGGITFSFTLKPRFAMNAQSAESILYDYYNPLARASVEPVRFTVQ